MTQADAVHTGARDIVPTGILPEISRRSLIGAFAALPALALPVAVIAADAPSEDRVVREMREARAGHTAKFWKLYDELQALEDEWEGLPEGDRSAALEDLVSAKFDQVLMQGVFCPLAVLKKLELVRFDAGGCKLPAPVHTVAQMIEWDLERCAKEQLFQVSYV